MTYAIYRVGHSDEDLLTKLTVRWLPQRLNLLLPGGLASLLTMATPLTMEIPSQTSAAIVNVTVWLPGGITPACVLADSV